MDTFFLVFFRGKYFAYDRARFLKFALKQTRRNWEFLVGELNSNKPLKASISLKEEEVLALFDPKEIQPLLEYKARMFAGKLIYDKLFFNSKIHVKYGKRIGWNDEYNRL